MKARNRLRDLRYWVLNKAKERPKWLGKTIYETMKKKSQEPAFLEKSEKAKKNRRGGSISNPVEPSHFQGSISVAQHAKKMTTTFVKTRGFVKTRLRFDNDGDVVGLRGRTKEEMEEGRGERGERICIDC
ncbi:hypothetical protein BVRB_8g200200 [Beta vulgaris subsp. vulgaris]|uniref:Uncharacterized protein n=1 Tax=Beta vulgaris subsp. vulgaris TaxID=3555 RepID=A0A7G2RLZ8_BETVV|nr:hypothetical protein BVRB_8g200200 [Beta vulgaris subsp. vulgaris]